MELVRADMLPEHQTFPDKGCRFAPSCLDCPLNECVYDVPGRRNTVLKAERATRIYELRTQGRTVRELAAEFGMSERAVYRIVQLRGPSPEAVALINRIGPDAAGKPVSAIGNGGIRQRAPWPVMREAR